MAKTAKAKKPIKANCGASVKAADGGLLHVKGNGKLPLKFSKGGVAKKKAFSVCSNCTSPSKCKSAGKCLGGK